MNRMKGKGINLLVILFASILFVSLVQEVQAARSIDPAKLKVVKGIIKENSPGSFILVDETGKEEQFYTGRETRYVPNDFRSRKGDEVGIRYYMKKSRRGDIVPAVIRLEIIRPDPKRPEPKNPSVGTVVEAGEKMYKLKLEEFKEPMTFDLSRSTKYIPSGWKPVAGDKVKINYKRVPSRWGNYYIYAVIRFEKVK